MTLLAWLDADTNVGALLLADGLIHCPWRAGVDRHRPVYDFARSRAFLADIGLNHHIDGAAGHNQMFHVIAPDQHKAAATIDVGLIYDVKALFGLRAEELTRCASERR